MYSGRTTDQLILKFSDFPTQNLPGFTESNSQKIGTFHF